MLINRHNCIQCCIKHLASAAVIAREILNGHDTAEYRFYLIGNLNEAQEQITGIDPNLARLIRTIRLKTAPQGLDAELTAPTLRLLERIAATIDARQKHGLYSGALPEAASRCRCVPSGAVDVLIPLRADGSKNGNLELQFALRSIERNLRGFRKIWIVSEAPPAGFEQLGFIRCADDRPRKQMNIHRAITAALRHREIADEVIFWADDNVLLAPLDVRELPVAARTDGLLGFPGGDDARVWHRSLRQTGEALRARGLPTVNYEAHTPVRFLREKYLALENEFDFESGVGFCYISLYLNYYGVEKTVPMRQVKATAEDKIFDPATLKEKLFAGFNDAGLAAGMAEELRRRFPERSRYETAPSTVEYYPVPPKLGAVIGTFGTPFYVELQLAALARWNPMPVLVVDDGSGDPELPRVCAKYGAEFLPLARRHGHCAGDLQIFAAGLEWAGKNGISLLVKLSRRFLPLREWKSGLVSLARESNAVTFSSWSTSYGLGFRTECLGLCVPAWQPVIPAMRSAVPNGRHFVERFMHEKARMLVNAWSTRAFERYCETHDPDRRREGYAFWTDLLGTDRKNPVPGVLWHDVHAEADYRAAAGLLGITP